MGKLKACSTRLAWSFNWMKHSYANGFPKPFGTTCGEKGTKLNRQSFPQWRKPFISFTEAYKKKSLDRNGNSVFTDEQREVELSFSNEARDKKMGRYADALRSARARTEDFPSPQNSKLVIRKFGGIVIRSGEMLYPNVSVMLAGASFGKGYAHSRSKGRA